MSLSRRGARAVAEHALAFSHRATHAHVGLVNSAPAILVTPRGRLVTVMTFTITNGRIVAIDIIADPQRLDQLLDVVRQRDDHDGDAT